MCASVYTKADNITKAELCDLKEVNFIDVHCCRLAIEIKLRDKKPASAVNKNV